MIISNNTCDNRCDSTCDITYNNRCDITYNNTCDITYNNTCDITCDHTYNNTCDITYNNTCGVYVRHPGMCGGQEFIGVGSGAHHYGGRGNRLLLQPCPVVGIITLIITQ